MKKHGVVVITVVGILLPLQAIAACFTDGTAVYRVKSVPIAAPDCGFPPIASCGNTPFIMVIGQAFSVCGTSENSLLTGSTRARPDGSARFGLSVMGSATCPPYNVQGVVAADGTGTGSLWVNGASTAVNFSPSSQCQ